MNKMKAVNRMGVSLFLTVISVMIFAGCDGESSGARPDTALQNENASLRSDIDNLKQVMAEQVRENGTVRKENDELRKGKGLYMISTWIIAGICVVSIAIGFAMGVKVKHEQVLN